MEARLFIISIWCGIYGQIIRFVQGRSRLANARWTMVGLNGLFWATFAVMGGMLIASYAERTDNSLQYAIVFGLSGLVAGGGLGYWRGARRETREELLRDNLEWADTGFSAILLASVVMFFFVQAFKIPSGSMRMTFVEGDHLFVNKFIYGFQIPLTEKKIAPLRAIQTNDIVIFRFPARVNTDEHAGKDFIKRAVALGGQKVEIVNKKLYVDGQPRREAFKQHVEGAIHSRIAQPSFAPPSPERFQILWERGDLANSGNEVRDNFGPVIVPEGHVFVMGDNRDRSFDSRWWGPLKISHVKGKAWFLYFPFSRARVIK